IASLKDAFFSGQLKPGDAIVERHLARQMKIGSPAVREALITLQEQGFVQRVANTATYVNKFSAEEIRQLFEVRIEFEILALKWAKVRVTEEDLRTLEGIIRSMVEVAVQKKAREFFEQDLRFHRHCWKMSGNRFLERSLENLVPPLFAFVLNASVDTVQESVARRHSAIVTALRSVPEPEFTNVARETLSGFALSAISSIAARQERQV
ncbi:MAG TPA: GntR family transcriptional regulator, partial [Bryobacteraceae bacterium]|nr:GntR family transcriptional regulator [Bryobacteraceae bacterium]